jgi:hypothetical protein
MFDADPFDRKAYGATRHCIYQSCDDVNHLMVGPGVQLRRGGDDVRRGTPAGVGRVGRRAGMGPAAEPAGMLAWALRRSEWNRSDARQRINRALRAVVAN